MKILTIFLDFVKNTVCQSHDVVEIPSAVLAVMEQLRCNLEMKSGEKTSDSKIKFMGRIKRPPLSWIVSA